MDPRILVFAGSIRAGSLNAKLAALAVKEIAIAGGEVTQISLADYPLPIYDGDLEASQGVPATAMTLKRFFSQHHGIFIASPEYNASISPLVKNTLDWISRVKDDDAASAFKDRVFAVGSASPGGFGGIRGLLALRQVLEIGLGALVLPEQASVPRAMQAFDEGGELTDERAAAVIRNLAKRLVHMSRQYAY